MINQDRQGRLSLKMGLLSLSGLALAVATALAQTPGPSAISGLAVDDQGARTAPPAVKESPQTTTGRGRLTVSGNLRLRAESWDWFESQPYENSYTFGAATLRLGLSQQWDRFEWQVEGAMPLLLGLPEKAVAPGAPGQLGLGGTYFAANGYQDAGIFIKQASIRFKGLGGDKASSLKLGRFEFNDGLEIMPADASLATIKRDHIAQRLIGTFGFTHVGRSFDGLHFVRQNRGGNLTFVAARPTEGVFQLRGWNQLDVDFYYGSFSRPRKYKSGETDLRVFALHYHDGRRVLKTDNRPANIRAADPEKIRITTLGGHYTGIKKAGSGKADLLLWVAGQFGSWGRLDHRAGALAVESGYQFGTGKVTPWLRAGYFRSSGDGDPNDGRHGTFFQALPTPRIYARFPFFDSMNLEDISLEFRLKPHSRLALRTDLHELRLSSVNDLWYLGGGAFQQRTFGFTGRPSNNQRRLGTLADVSTELTVNPTTTLTFYLAGVRGGGVPARIYPDGKNGRLLFLELTKRF
jgi:hypothetical protein